jgi:low temperature requirement protein LtrA
MRRMRELSVPPRLRTLEDEDGERRATWLELFVDLVFVVAVAQLSNGLARHDTVHGFLVFAALWVAVWWAWVGFTFYADRFDTDDFTQRILAFTLMFATAGLASTIPAAFDGSTRGFAVGYAIVRTITMVMNARAWWHLRDARPLLNVYIPAFAVAIALFLVSTAAAAPGRYVLWGAALVVDLGTPLLFSRRIEQIPIGGSHIPERVGLLTTIVFGETVLAVVVGTEHSSWSFATGGIAALGFTIAATLWWIYYDYLDTSLVRGTVRAGQVYLYAHLPLLIGLTALGPAVKLAIGGEAGDRPARIAAVGVTAVLISLAVLHLATSRSGRDTDAWLRIGSGVAILAAGLAAPWLHVAGVLAAAAAALVAQLAYELLLHGDHVFDPTVPLGPSSRVDLGPAGAYGAE